MRKLLFCTLVPLLALPGYATISQVQANAKFGATGTSCQVLFTSNPTTRNLIAVWTSWTTSGTNNVTVTSVRDTLDNGIGTAPNKFFPSAVGPTLQSASNTAGQIFYAANITGSSSDTVTVTFSSAPSSSNCVIVEYQGLDLNYPLDSASAGYSTLANPTGLLDSGVVAPANTNLLVFGAGTTDATGGAITAGSGFSTILSNGNNITESNTNPITANNTLWRATASYPGNGNWLMQTAVFRGASSTVTGGWNPARPSAIRYADQFPGADACVQIANAFADLPSIGGTIDARGLGTGSNPLTCSVNPIPSNAKGRLLLSSGTYLAQVPWVIQSNDVNIVGTGGGVTSGNTNSTIQACVLNQPNCGGNVFPSARAVIEVGPVAAGLFQVTVKELNVDCNDAPGVSGVSMISTQEETVFDLVRATGCRIAGFDIGQGDTQDQNGAALSNFQVKYPSSNGCPNVTQGTISSISRNASGVVSVALSAAPSPPVADGYEVVITGVTGSTVSFNGTYRVNPGSTPTTFSYNQASTVVESASTGFIKLFPVGVRVWQKSGSPVRPIINGTINGAGCNSAPPIAMELSGGFPFVHNIHTEGFNVGIQIGDLSGTNGATLSNLKLENQTQEGIVISNQWTTSGGAPDALPSGNINIFNLDVTGGDGNVTTSIDDRINGNLLTKAVNGTVGYYMYGQNGVMTSALPESGLKNAFDVNNQTLAIYSGSASAAFSAGPTAVTMSGATINAGVVNGGTGVKHVRSASTGIPANSHTEVVISWPGVVHWSDTSYSVTCSVEQASGTGLVGERIHTKSTTQIGYVVNNTTALALNAIVDCVGVHD